MIHRLRKIRFIGFLLLPFAVLACTNDPTTNTQFELSERLKGHLHTYEARQTIVLELLRESTDHALITRETRTLVDLSVPILDTYMIINPRSRGFLNATKTVLNKIDTISEEAIERDYHDEAILPSRPDDQGISYHIKDLLVHPATVLVLLREEDWESRRDDMISEIERNIRHVAGVRVAFP